MRAYGGETARIWGAPLERYPGKLLEKQIRGYFPVIVKAK